MLWVKSSSVLLCMETLNVQSSRQTFSSFSLCCVQDSILQVHDGIRLHFYPTNSRSLHIKLHTTTAQDLTLDLGPPLRIHYKEDERMTIHSTNKSTDDFNAESDCVCVPFYLICCTQPTGLTDFYNYFQHGLDFFISGSTHTVKKIIVHTNIVCSFRSHLPLKSLFIHHNNSLGHLSFNDISAVTGKSKALQKTKKTVRLLCLFLTLLS